MEELPEKELSDFGYDVDKYSKYQKRKVFYDVLKDVIKDNPDKSEKECFVGLKQWYVENGKELPDFKVERKGWTESEKEQVRINQDGKCAICQKPPPRWEYDHIDGNRENNDLSNCQGLCPNCHSVKTHES